MRTYILLHIYYVNFRHVLNAEVKIFCIVDWRGLALNMQSVTLKKVKVELFFVKP